MISARLTAHINPAQVALISKTLERIHQVTWMESKEIIKMATAMAVKSAAKATRPGTAAHYSEMAQKFRIRPVVRMSDYNGYHYYEYFDRTGNRQVFRSRNVIHQGKRARDPIMAKQAIKKWNKRGGDWRFSPFWGDKKDKKARNRQIPGAGAAKMGWYQSLPKLDPKNKFDTMGRYKKELSALTVNLQGTSPYVRVVNLVDYTSKTSPDSAAVGIRAADARMYATYLKKLDSQIMRTWNNAA
jgi:hypothetical protein